MPRRPIPGGATIPGAIGKLLGCTSSMATCCYTRTAVRDKRLRFILTFALIERIRASVLDLYTTESLESTLCAVGEQQQKNKLR